MSRRVSDLTVDELEQVVEKIVRRTLDDYVEDLEALRSEKYVNSIAEAREEYRRGEVKRLDDLEND